MNYPYDVFLDWSLTEIRCDVLSVICKLDSDDMSTKEAIEKLLHVAQSLRDIEERATGAQTGTTL